MRFTALLKFSQHIGCDAMPVSGVAVLGKDNNPLYIRAYGQHDHLRFHFIVHTALDFLEEKRARPAANPPPPRCVRARS